MADFDTCFETLIKFEGTKFTDDPDDPGGPTKFGITLKAWMEYALDQGCPTDYDFLTHLKDMTKETAQIFYTNNYWEKYKYWGINSTDVAERILLASVHLGPRRAHYAVQRALRASGELGSDGAPIKEDGILGPKTLKALNQHTVYREDTFHSIFRRISADDMHIIVALRSEVAAYYRRIFDKEPERKAKYYEGFMRRAYY